MTSQVRIYEFVANLMKERLLCKYVVTLAKKAFLPATIAIVAIKPAS